MARKRAQKPSWFKLFGMHGAMMQALPSESLGEGMKGAMTYFSTGALPELTDPLAIALFAALKPQIDEAYEDFRRSVESGRAGGLKSAHNNTPGTGPLHPPSALLTEGEGEEEGEGEGEKKDTSPKGNSSFRAGSLPGRGNGRTGGSSGLDRLARMYEEEFRS